MAIESEKTQQITATTSDTPNQTVAEVLVQYPSQPLLKNVGLLKLYGALVPGVLLVSATVGYDGSMLNGLQSLDTFNDFFRPSATISGLINATFWLGGTVGYPLAPFIADRWGRKAAIYAGALFIALGVILQGAAQNLGMFVVARIMFGISTSLNGSASPVLIAELAHPRDRKVFTALYNGFYYLGAITAAWTEYGTFKIPNDWGWRIPSILQGAFCVVNMAFLWAVPESPRWLVKNGKAEQARQEIARAHVNGDIDHPLVTAQFNEIYDAISREEIDKKSSWTDLYTSRNNRKRLFILLFIGTCMNLSGNGLVSYYLSRILTNIGIKSQKSQTIINGILQIVSFFSCLVASWAAGWVRRRTQFLTSATVMFGSFLAVTIANSIVFEDENNNKAGVAVVFFVFLFMVGYNWGFNSLAYAYPVEILPYNTRMVGLASVNLTCYITGFFNTFVNPIALEDINWRYYIVYVVWLAVEIAVIFFIFPETLGYALEEISEIFDKEPVFSFRGAAKISKGFETGGSSEKRHNEVETQVKEVDASGKSE